MTNETAPSRTPKDAVLFNLKKGYVVAARTVGKVLTATHVLPKTPPPRSKKIRHWLTSLTRVYDSMAVVELDVPWWSYKAIDEVEAWLATRPRPIRVFEWGSGASTIWLSRFTDEIITVEHHDEFAEMIAPHLAKLPNVSFRHVQAPASDKPKIPSLKAGSEGLDFFDYVHAIDDESGLFDLIIIDGRARRECLTQAIPKLADDGLIVYDDTHRKRNQAAIDRSGLHANALRGLTPTLPYPDTTSLLTKRS